eukprot:3247481-Amphidinium_carterae.2
MANQRSNDHSEMIRIRDQMIIQRSVQISRTHWLPLMPRELARCPPLQSPGHQHSPIGKSQIQQNQYHRISR